MELFLSHKLFNKMWEEYNMTEMSLKIKFLNLVGYISMEDYEEIFLKKCINLSSSTLNLIVKLLLERSYIRLDDSIECFVYIFLL